MGRIIRRTAAALLIVTGLLTAAIVGAALQIFDGTGQYIMSDDLDHEFGKKRAQQRAERDAQKKAGVALKNFSRSVNRLARTQAQVFYLLFHQNPPLLNKIYKIAMRNVAYRRGNQPRLFGDLIATAGCNVTLPAFYIFKLTHAD